MQLGKFLNTPTGKIMMSIILGFGLASLFRTVCKEKNCLIFMAPPHDEIDGKIYKYQDIHYSELMMLSHLSYHISPIQIPHPLIQITFIKRYLFDYLK